MCVALRVLVLRRDVLASTHFVYIVFSLSLSRLVRYPRICRSSSVSLVRHKTEARLITRLGLLTDPMRLVVYLSPHGLGSGAER